MISQWEKAWDFFIHQQFGDIWRCNSPTKYDISSKNSSIIPILAHGRSSHYIYLYLTIYSNISSSIIPIYSNIIHQFGWSIDHRDATGSWLRPPGGPGITNHRGKSRLNVDAMDHIYINIYIYTYMYRYM